jgi:hypothetical protein
MTAWTWMRYSYAWPVSGGELWRVDLKRPGALYAPWPSHRRKYHDLYIRFSVRMRSLDGAYRGPEWVRRDAYGPGLLRVDLGDTLAPSEFPQEGREVTFLGRVNAWRRTPVMDTAASRFHPASIAGFVVGAMGCLIFGLYLRRWLVDRKALSGPPQRDMVA